MANMSANQRAQVDRIDLAIPTTGTRVRDRRPVAAFTVLALIVLAALTYVAGTAIDGWASLIVLGAAMLTAVGAMIAVSPNARG
jgi:hypothetical protein